MKFSFLVLLLIVFTTQTANSQKIKAEDISYAVDFNLAYNFISADLPSEIETDGFIGWQLGGTVAYKLSQKWALGSGLNLARKGGNIITSDEYEYTDQNGRTLTSVESLEQQIRLTYLQLPLFVNYNINSRFQIQAGVQLGYLTTAESTFNYEDMAFPADDESVTFDMLEDSTFNFLGSTIMTRASLNRFELSGSIRFSYSLTKNLSVSFLTNIGLTQIDENSTAIDDDSVSFDSLGIKNRSFMIGLSYRLNDTF